MKVHAVSSKWVLLLGLTFLSSPLATSSVQAESLPAFFEKNSAISPLAGEMNFTTPDELVMLPPARKIEVEEEATPVKFDQQPENKKETSKRVKDRRLEQPKTKEDILAAFGAPNEPYPMGAEESAPAPFKGMVAAMNAGDDKLAFEYALQYARYQEQVRSQNMKITGFLGQAQRREGLLPPGSWPDRPENSEYAGLREMELEFKTADELAAQNPQPGAVVDINAEAQELMEKARKSKFALLDDDRKDGKVALEKWGELERLKVRQNLAASLPVDPNGQVMAYFFFKAGDDQAYRMAPDLNRLNEEFKKTGKGSLMGMALGNTADTRIVEFVNQTKAQFPVVPGAELAKQLDIKSSPALIFATAQGKSYLVQGENNFFYLDEIRKVMQGVK